MRFGSLPVGDSVGSIAVHGIQVGAVVVRKGETITDALAASLHAAGVREIVAAGLDPGDVGENEAARRLAEAAMGRNLRVDRAFTGRANVFAESAGVLTVDTATVDRINGGDEAITLATLPSYKAVVAGEMVATVKIIPFAVSGPALRQALSAIDRPPLHVVAYRPLRVGIISTLLPGLKDSAIAKTLRVMEQRLEPAGASIACDDRVAHRTDALAAALRRQVDRCDLVVVFGASAITDRRDVVPAGLVEAGGTVEHFGMPVDPGNLLLLGSLGGRTVLGAPGCARSPKENGFDWVLQRLLAGLAVTPADIRKLGGGGLLMEIVSRPQPRAGLEGAADRDDDA